MNWKEILDQMKMNNILKPKLQYSLLSLLLLLTIHSVFGVQPASALNQPSIEYYLKKVEVAKGEGVIKEEVRKYRSFPHLDRAYRLQHAKRFNEARQEFDAYIVLAPDDIRSRVSYLVLLEKLSRTDEVIAQADLIISRWPTFVPAYFFKGLALQKAGNPDVACAVFSAAAEIKDIQKEDRRFALTTASDVAVSAKNYEAAGRVMQSLLEVEKSYAMYMKAGLVFEKRGSLKESFGYYAAAQGEAKSPAEKIAASLALAEIAKKLNNSEQAYQAYKTVLTIDGSNRSATRGLAHLTYSGKKYDEAERWIISLVQLDSKSEDREFLARLYLKKRNYAAAIKELNEVVKQQGNKVSLATLASLAQAYESVGRYQESAAVYEMMLVRAPEKGDTLLRYGMLLIRMDKFSEAEPVLKKSLELGLSDQQQAVAHKNLALTYEKSSNYEKAAEELEKSLLNQPAAEPGTLVRLALLLNRVDKPKEALLLLDKALTEMPESDKLTCVALREKGLILESSGRQLEAALEYEKAISLGDRSPAIYLTVAHLYQSSQNMEKAMPFLSKVIEHPDATNIEKCSAEDGIGMYYFNQGRLDDAAGHFSTALSQCGESWQRHYYLGLARYRSLQWQQALDQFLVADKLQKDSGTLIGIALCYKELDKPGAAVYYLQEALQEPGTNPDKRKQIFDTLGYLYAEEQAYDKAADAFAQSLMLSPDYIVSLKLAGVYNSTGKSDEAWNALAGAEVNRLSIAETIEYNDLRSDLLQKGERYEEALAAMEQSQLLLSTPSRSYSLGLIAQKAGQRQKAVEHFESAYHKGQQQDDYALSLGYAYIADGRYSDAIGIFEVVANRNPTSVKVREELGYLYISAGDNERAVEWFKKTLDSFPVMPHGSSAETVRWELDAHRLRSEISKLTKTFSAVFYAAYRTGKVPLANGEQIIGGLSGQAGFEAAYRPPGIGLRNDHILELFGRVFGNLNSNSLHYNDNSTQAGIGLRYKFLQSENLWVSAERLVKIGRYALDDWLIRLLYSRGTGSEPVPLVNNQDYYLIFSELDGYLKSETVAASAEVRKGRSFSLQPNCLLAPYLVLDGRWQSTFNAGGNYVEGGAGVSLKYFFNNSKYENFRSVVDFSLNYKHGMYTNQGFNKNNGEYDSVILSLGLFF